MLDPADSKAKLTFNLGADDIDIYFDSVSLAVEPIPTPEPTPESSPGNYPPGPYGVAVGSVIGVGVGSGVGVDAITVTWPSIPLGIPIS